MFEDSIGDGLSMGYPREEREEGERKGVGEKGKGRAHGLLFGGYYFFKYAVTEMVVTSRIHVRDTSFLSSLPRELSILFLINPVVLVYRHSHILWCHSRFAKLPRDKIRPCVIVVLLLVLMMVYLKPCLK